MSDRGSQIAALSELLEGATLEVDRRVLPDDPMHSYNPDLYFDAGRQALRNINLALLAAKRASASSILDFACGGGRVLRYLRAAFPEAAVAACDLYEAGVAFCAEAFDAFPIEGKRNLEEFEISGPFDLIWVGSLFTHIGKDDWNRLLGTFQQALSDRGVLVFTVYGRNIVSGLRARRFTLDLSDEHIAEIVQQYDETGFGFFPDLNPEARHGDAIASRAWVCSRLNDFPLLKLTLYTENAWLGQDVVACTKGEGPS